MVNVSVLVVLVSLINAPVPLIIPDKVCAALEEYWKVPLLAILPAYEPDPREPEPPIKRVPALTVVIPEYVLTPFSVQVPASTLVTVPVEVPMMDVIDPPTAPPRVRP